MISCRQRTRSVPPQHPRLFPAPHSSSRGRQAQAHPPRGEPGVQSIRLHREQLLQGRHRSRRGGPRGPLRQAAQQE